MKSYPRLQEAYDYARRHGVIIVAASGNLGNIGSISLIDNEWIIPVAACDEYGRLDSISNFGPSIGSRGLMAPGIDVRSTKSGGGNTRMSGTSFAAPFITGTIALLLSMFPKASIADIKRSTTSIDDVHRYRSIIPRLLNAEQAMKRLRNKYA